MANMLSVSSPYTYTRSAPRLEFVMSNIAIRLLVLAPFAVALSACVSTVPTTQQSIPAGTWTTIVEDNSHFYYFDPYRLSKVQNTWVIDILAQNKATLQVQGPAIWRVNCERLSFSENGPPLGSPRYTESFRPIPSGSNVANVAVGLCGFQWSHDNAVYFFLSNSLGPPFLSVWLRRNEVTHKRNGDAELIAAYVNGAAGTTSPVRITVNCSTRRFIDTDLTTGAQLSSSIVPPNSLRVDAIVYDRACNRNNSFIVHRNESIDTFLTDSSNNQVANAQKLCSELGISPGTQPFRVCVKQLAGD